MRTQLICPNRTLTNSDLMENPFYYHIINPSTDLQPGTVASAQLKFVTTYSGLNIGDEVTFKTQQTSSSSFVQVGIFYIDTISKKESLYTVTAYDSIVKFNKNCEGLLNTSTSTNISDLFNEICTAYGQTPYSLSFTNDYCPVFPKELAITGISARTVLGYIAELAGGFIIARPNGEIEVKRYGNSSDTPTKWLGDGDYDTATFSDHNTPVIGGVQAQTSNGTISAGSSTDNVVYLQFNPIIYGHSSTIGPIIQDLYTELSSTNGYTPCNFHCHTDHGINVGDLISVDLKRVLVFQKKLDDGGCTFICTGRQARDNSVLTNSQRIKRQEAEGNGVDYHYNNKYFDFSSSKVFMDDLYINGLGYDENPNNVSLLTVINYLLIKEGYKSTAQPVYETVTLWSSTPVTTPFSTNDYGYSIVSGDSVLVDATGQYYRLSPNPNTSDEFGRTVINLTQSVGGVSYTVFKLNVDVYSTTQEVGVEYTIPYSKSGADYYDIMLKGYYKSGNNWVKVGDSFDDWPAGNVDNGYIRWNIGSEDGIFLTLQAVGDYKIEVFNHIEQGPFATWEISSSYAQHA